jgi:hypothetical protein
MWHFFADAAEEKRTFHLHIISRGVGLLDPNARVAAKFLNAED